MIRDKPTSFTKYLAGNDHVYHKLPARLADLLSGKKARIVMYDHKTMRAFYNTMGMHFIGGELYTDCFGCEPAGDDRLGFLRFVIFATITDLDITEQQ